MAYINKEQALNKINEVVQEAPGEQVSFSADSLKFLIDSLPSVDAVEVVRCKDCRFKCERTFGIIEQFTAPFCGRLLVGDGEIDYLFIDENDYCKWGEKNETN